jgi:hypothetical protein
MVEQTLVTVYAFRQVEDDIETGRHAPFKATREAIRDIYRGHLLDGTQEEVPVEALDTEGRYRRVATGWGDLN